MTRCLLFGFHFAFTCAERSHSHRGFSPVMKSTEYFSEPFLTVSHNPRQQKPLKRFSFSVAALYHRAKAAV
jgi:hypothetical protein